MAGIYIHIPFCRQACHYCDFHFSTNLQKQSDMVEAICQEIENRKDYLKESINTIYFGGGTPSLLSALQVRSILESIKKTFQLSETPEVTLEANPEDLNSGKLVELKNAGIDRLSIGVQTFHDEKLKWMNRAHTSVQATETYQRAREAGFKNISLDLIYARPNEASDAWSSDLQKVIDLQPDHISLYGLTIEEKTVFGKWEKNEKLVQLPEESAANQYLEAISFLKENGFAQYEVSNFCRPGFESRHNGAYWTGTPYLGIGPGAHSFDGKDRHINIRNNAKYLKLIGEEEPHFEIERLSKIQRINEHILTSLRTIKGLDFSELKKKWNVDMEEIHGPFIQDLCDKEMAQVQNGKMSLLPHGFLVADEISLQMFFDE